MFDCSWLVLMVIFRRCQGRWRKRHNSQFIYLRLSLFSIHSFLFSREQDAKPMTFISDQSKLSNFCCCWSKTAWAPDLCKVGLDISLVTKNEDTSQRTVLVSDHGDKPRAASFCLLYNVKREFHSVWMLEKEVLGEQETWRQYPCPSLILVIQKLH